MHFEYENETVTGQVAPNAFSKYLEFIFHLSTPEFSVDTRTIQLSVDKAIVNNCSFILIVITFPQFL